MSDKLSAYVAAGIPPALASAFWLLLVPPLWLGTDSTSLTLWPTIITPHYPPLYPLVIYLFEKSIGIGPAMLWTLLVLQHLFFIGAIVYLACAARVAWQALILSVAATAGVYFGVFAHLIATQGIDVPFLALMVGVALRYHLDGWRWSLLPVFLVAAFGVAMTRHADMLLAVLVPAYWLLRAAYARLYDGRASRPLAVGYLGHALICGLGLGLVVLAISPTQRLTCWFFGRDCPYSIVGRAGCYRIAKIYAMVPPPQRTNWIADKTRGLSPDETFAFKAMAADGNCWIGPYQSIAKAFPQRDTDRLMDAAYLGLMRHPDRYALDEMAREFSAGLYLDQGRYLEYMPFAEFLDLSARTVARTDDGIHYDMRKRFGADAGADAAVQATLAKHPVVTAYAWFTFHLVNAIAVVGLLGLLIFDRRPSFIALGTAMAVAALSYALAVSAVTVMVPIYVMPVTFLSYVWLGLLALTLVDAIGSSGRRKPG